MGKGKSSEWVSGENRRYVLDADHIPELERESYINEFVNKRPRDEAESGAYSDYRKKHLLQAAAHHLAAMKSASAAGDHKNAKKHKLVYDLILQELGYDPNDHKVPTEIQGIMDDPEKNPDLGFRAHKGDAFLLKKSAEPIYITPDWQLSDIEFKSEALLAPMPMVKKEIPPLGKSDNPLQVNFGVNKLRQLRDWFDQQGLKSINERDVPEDLRQRLMHVGRDYGGNFLRDRIQQAIEAAPPRDYNFSTGTYETAHGATQRHSKQPSNVFRLDMTPEQEQQMRTAGVLDAYQGMYGLASASGHPVSPGNLGWVRWTGDKSGVHLDEVQSDYGRPWPAFFADQFQRMIQRGDIRPGELERYVSHYNAQYPEEKRKIIQKIAFGNKHPAEVLQEGFAQWARTHGGLEGAPVHIWQPEAKVYQATVDPEMPWYRGQGDLGRFDYTRPIPGHLQTAYRDVPIKMGYGEGQYGEIPTQSTAKFKRQPPKKALAGVVGGDIQWRPSTKTYKDVIRGPETTPKAAEKPVTRKEIAKAALDMVKGLRKEILDKGMVSGLKNLGLPDNRKLDIAAPQPNTPQAAPKPPTPSLASSEKKPYMGRDPASLNQHRAPGTPDANKQGVGRHEDKKKLANKYAARKPVKGDD